MKGESLAAAELPLASVAEAITRAMQALTGLADPRAEALALVAAALGLTRTQLIAYPARDLSTAESVRVQAWCARRAAGEPLAYLTGRRGFWSLTLAVGPGVLVPRPESELLVELALAEDFGAIARPRILDLGTGSGAIALSVARERPAALVWAVERSPAALTVARANAVCNGLAHVQLRESDWFSALAGERFHLILGNPPYLAADDPALISDGLCFEPAEALVADADGLADLTRIIATAPAHLHPGAALWLEHGATQAEAVREHLSAVGFSQIESHPDLAGRPRVTGGRWPGPA